MDKLRDFLKAGQVAFYWFYACHRCVIGVESHFGGSVDPNQVAQVGGQVWGCLSIKLR